MTDNPQWQKLVKQSAQLSLFGGFFAYFSPYDNSHDPKIGVLENIEDQNYLESMIEDKDADINMRLKEIMKLKNTSFLHKYVIATQEDSKPNHIVAGKNFSKVMSTVASIRLEELEK